MVPDLLGAPLTLLPELVSARLLPFTLGALTVLFVPELIRAQYRLKQRGANQRAWPGGLLDPLGRLPFTYWLLLPGARTAGSCRSFFGSSVECLSSCCPTGQCNVHHFRRQAEVFAACA